MNKYLYFLLICLISCSDNPGKNDNEQLKPDVVLSYEKAQPFEVRYSDVFSSVETIPLDTVGDFLIQNISEMDFALNRFFALDMDKRLFVFDRQGKGLAKIDQYGQGCQQYLSIRGFEISLTDSLICLLTFPTKLMYFSLDGKFVKETSLDFDGSEMRFLKDRSLAVFTDNLDGETMLKTYQLETRSRKEFLPAYDWLAGRITPAFGQRRNLVTLPDGEVLYFYQYSNDIYSVTTDSVKIKYRIDFGKKNPIGPTQLPDVSRLSADEILETYYRVYGFNSCWENSRYFYIDFLMLDEPEKPHELLFDKQTSKLYTGWFCDDVGGDCGIRPVRATDEYLLGYYSADELSSLADYLEATGKKLSYPQAAKLIKWANNEGNPIVALYSFK